MRCGPPDFTLRAAFSCPALFSESRTYVEKERLEVRYLESTERIASSTVIGNVESALKPHKYRTDPIPGELNCTGCPESRNRFPDVAFFMHACSMLIGLAGFEWEGYSTDAANDALSRRRLDGACHNMVLLADNGINRRNTNLKLQWCSCNSLATHFQSRKPGCDIDLRYSVASVLPANNARSSSS